VQASDCAEAAGDIINEPSAIADAQTGARRVETMRDMGGRSIGWLRCSRLSLTRRNHVGEKLPDAIVMRAAVSSFLVAAYSRRSQLAPMPHDRKAVQQRHLALLRDQAHIAA